MKTCTKGCVTESWKSCVFPFTYAGTTYTACTKDDSSKAWCSTENKADGSYKNWGYCAMETCSEVVSVDGNWGDWSSWSACSVTCGSGSKSRSRSCDNPAPVLGGKDCSGDAAQQVDCNDGVCPGCVTTKGQSCVFPFKYRGKIYTSCTKDGYHTHWCSTENKADGYYKTWGVCSMDACNQAASDHHLKNDALDIQSDDVLEQLDEISNEIEELKKDLEVEYVNDDVKK